MTSLVNRDLTATVLSSFDYTYNYNNQLTTETIDNDTTILYTYDDNGNLLLKTDGANTTTFTWDWRNMLLSVSDSTDTTTYAYDGDGNRISKTVDGVKTNYINDVASPLVQVLMETDDTGDTVLATYTYGNDLISINNEQLSINNYYHYDGLGSTRQLTDDTEAVVASYTYDSFGNVIAQTTGGGMAYNSPVEENNPINKVGVGLLASLMLGMGIVTTRCRPIRRIGGRGGVLLILVLSTALITISIPTSTATETGTTGNSYGFTGEQQFGEADGLIFLRARYYDPSIGRFISRDPILSPMAKPSQNQVFILIENAHSNSPKFTILKEPVWLVPFLIYNPQILNSYNYCFNNPVNYTDPNGLVAPIVVIVIWTALGITLLNAWLRTAYPEKFNKNEDGCDTDGDGQDTDISRWEDEPHYPGVNPTNFPEPVVW